VPLDARMESPEVRRELLDCLTDDLKIPHHGIERLVVGGERIAGLSLGIPPDLPEALEDVLQVNPRVQGHEPLRLEWPPEAVA
jgi:hypothetical protein